MVKLYTMYDKNALDRWSWVYFHGLMESVIAGHIAVNRSECMECMGDKEPEENHWHPPDLVASDMSLDALSDGIHEVDVYGNAAKLYLWTAKNRVIDGKKIRRGLVVLPQDFARVGYALKKFEEQSDRL
jgi:hypothetical protein